MCIVYCCFFGDEDKCLFEFGDLENELKHQAILFGSLDFVEIKLSKEKKACYIGIVDQHDDLFVSALITHCKTKILLLHKEINEEKIINVLNTIHRLYIDLILNPFYVFGTKINEKSFLNKIKDVLDKI